MKPSMGRTLIGGFIATLLITAVLYLVAPMLLGEPMDVAAMLAGITESSWNIGLFIHLFNGMLIFPFIYMLFMYRILPGDPWMKGAIFGLLLWLGAELVFVPLAGGGIFHANHPRMPMAVMGSLVGHLIYGVALGAIADGPRDATVGEPVVA